MNNVIQGSGGILLYYPFATFERKEVGSIEGRIVSLGTDCDEPVLKIREQRTNKNIRCYVAKEAREEIGRMLTAGDVWLHRRVRVRGVLNYDPVGKVVSVFDCRIVCIKSKDVEIDDLHDPEFTEGMSP